MVAGAAVSFGFLSSLGGLTPSLLGISFFFSMMTVVVQLLAQPRLAEQPRSRLQRLKWPPRLLQLLVQLERAVVVQPWLAVQLLAVHRLPNKR